MSSTKMKVDTVDGIAIVGMAGKFPGVENIYEYWDAICKGKELLKRFTDEELTENQVDKKTLEHNHFVPVNGLINTAEFFDSSFFGFTPREADLTDPQHRKFLEVCYEALEHAGQSPNNYEGTIGVFAGCSMNNYLVKNLLQFPDLLRNNGEFQTIVNNDKDFLTTKVSYKLNLTGPSFDIQTACSTSLVAIHVACQNLLNYQCDIALGGGSFIMTPRGQGYMYKEGGIQSPDGRCRPFDINANGTIFGEGVGVVTLKRLEDAIADKDEIWAVIKSSAINNDGYYKIGYMAPSSDGQAEAISMAMEFGNIDARTISYVETHGTGTNLGDPVEINGLTSVYRKYTQDKNYCAIGSVKANVGHCDVAAGVAGIIKTAMALKYKKIPPSINFNEANPVLELENSPFYVNTELKDWDVNGYPRRAAISSFGIGGTNSHCILEEWNDNDSKSSDNDVHILPLSAKNKKALYAMVENLVNHLDTTPQNLEDIAHTLQVGRNEYNHKGLISGKSKKEIVDKYRSDKKNLVVGKQEMEDPAIVFLFTGQGSQYVNMSKDLYESFELYKNIIDDAHDILIKDFSIDLKGLLFHDIGDKEHQRKVNMTSNTQPLLYTVQYATACLLMDLGIFPDALIGHSIGELTAAALSGVFTFEDALYIVASRGKIMQAQKEGSMLSVNIPSEKLKPHLNEHVELALQNAPSYSVVSGTHEAISAFQEELNKIDSSIHSTILKTSHAFHSSLMDPALDEFKKVFDNITFESPEIPLISNVTGTWITKEQACSADYWADHIRSTVLFSSGVNEILQSENEVIFFEVGPGNSLSMLLSQFESACKFKSISTIRHPKVKEDDKTFFLKAVSQYWITGGKIDWNELYQEEERYKVPLPTYPFEKQRHWINPLVNVNFYSETSNEVIPSSSASDVSSKAEQSETNSSAYHSRPDLGVNYIAPSTNTELLIVDIWKELLGIEGIGLDDDFFELGGHSLLASQLIVRINEYFNKKLPLDSIFDSPTIKLLIDKYNLEIIESAIEETSKRTTDNVNGLYKLSHEQKRLWIINKIEENNPAYNIPFTFKLTGDINIETLNKSFNILLDRHLALKSYITNIDNEPVSGINNNIQNIRYIDLIEQNPTNNNADVQTILSEDTRKSFDIEKGPLVRALLIKTSDKEFVFHLTVQHLVFDGWSWGIFAKEISQIYNDTISGKEVSLREPDIQYFDFAQWQHDSVEEGSLTIQKSVDFWKDQLKDIPLETLFPYDHKRPQIISGLGGRENINIDKELTAKIKKLCKESGTTMFMTMLTAFGVLISLYSKQNDICIGTPTGNRTKSKFEKIIGFFVNTIILRLKFDKTKSFSEILTSNRKVVLDSLEHQDLSFDQLVDILQPERVVNINPLFQIMFAWQNAPRSPLSFQGVTPERIVVKEGISPLDITFYMWENNGEIDGEIEFNIDILERESIIHLKHNYIKLLNEIVNQNNEPILKLSGISEYSLQKLDNFNNTSEELENKCLHELFEDIAEKYPTLEAVVAGKTRLTYDELNNKANKLAHHLLKQNIQGSFVGVSLHRTEKMLIAILAILKAGGSYLPLDPNFPDERLKYILKDSETRFLITTNDLKNKFKGVDAKLILLESIDSRFSFKSKKFTNPQIKTETSSLAYAIYTSGSTGNPKGVKIPHIAAVNFIKSMSKTPGMCKDDKLLAVTTLSFDISVLELFLPISVGAPVIIANNDEVADGKRLMEIIETEKINILQATPATWNVLLLSGWKGDKNLVALCGGEAIQPTLVKNLLPKVAKLWNMYGPTETTVWSSCYEITDADSPILVGQPIDNTQIFILDNNNQIQPPNVYGEVCIGGKGVAVGYHNRDELTKEKFIDLEENTSVYKTGDSGRIRIDGSIELAGRLDHQIKLRGFRIEPGEIETAIGKEEGIKEVVVKIQHFSDFDERLVAFVTSINSVTPDFDAIKSSIGAYLPGYMIPSNFMLLDDMPKTANGKIDRKALILDIEEVTDVDEKASEEITSTQQEILQIWQKVLKSKSIGINDDFFSIGGNSLIALSIVEKIEKKFNAGFSLRLFFNNPTILSISKFIEQSLESNTKKKLNEDSPSSELVQGEI